MKKDIESSSDIYDFFLKIVLRPESSCFFEKYGLNLSDFAEETHSVRKVFQDSLSKLELKDMLMEKHIMEEVGTTIHDVLVQSYSISGENYSCEDILYNFFLLPANHPNKHINLIRNLFTNHGFKAEKLIKEQKKIIEDKNLIKSKRKSLNKNGEKTSESQNKIKYTKEIEKELVIGRDSELEEVVLSLKRLKKNNPVLIGEAGVGKTALLSKLDSLLNSSEVPEFLKGYKVLELDLMEIISGAKFRGELEDRLRGLINTISGEKIILFIDEIHSLRGLGAEECNVVNLIKPHLTKGLIKVIGATTTSEWQKFLKRDEALERRFYPVIINEASKADTINILKRIKFKYEEKHEVSYSKNSFESMVEFSDKYNRFKKFPDKAIDLLDLLGAKAYMEGQKTVTKAYVEKYFKAKYKIYTKDIETFLNAEVINQEETSSKVAKRIKMYSKGLHDKTKPIASFLFLGETGTGKTLMSSRIAEYLNFNLERFDMSEYNSEADVNKLLGSPAGYVGYDSPSKLANAMESNPYNIFLFDEIEKAHDDVKNVFLQMLDYGSLTLANGKTIDFRNSIIIFTSNAGMKEKDNKSVGIVSSNTQESDKIIDGAFLREFLARTSEVSIFNSLTKDNSFDLVRLRMNEMFKERGFSMKFSKDVVELLTNSVNKKEGTRGLNKEIEEQIFVKLLDQDNFNDLEIKVKENEIVFV